MGGSANSLASLARKLRLRRPTPVEGVAADAQGRIPREIKSPPDGNRGPGRLTPKGSVICPPLQRGGQARREYNVRCYKTVLLAYIGSRFPYMRHNPSEDTDAVRRGRRWSGSPQRPKTKNGLRPRGLRPRPANRGCGLVSVFVFCVGYRPPPPSPPASEEAGLSARPR